MTDTWNVKGPADKVTSLIERLAIDHLVTDTFPCGPDERDVNLRIDTDQADEFTEMCEELGLEPKMV